MKFRIVILGVLMFLALSLFVFSEKQNPPKPVLKAGDVEHFIKTFPLLSRDFKALGAQYETHSGNMTFPDAMKANAQFNEILKTHGWDHLFFVKASTICMGYSSIVYGKEIQNANPELEKALKEIDSNPNLSAELKQQVKAGIKAAQGAISQQGAVLIKMVSAEDLVLINPFIKELKDVFEKTK